jgi:hypothetical protein
VSLYHAGSQHAPGSPPQNYGRGDGSVFQRERCKVRVPVVPVLVLLALQPADDRIGHRREEDLDGDLERPVEGDDLQHRPSLPGSEKGDRIEKGAVDELADRGRADRARPEMTPLGPDLHLRHDIAVHEVAAPVGDDRRGDDPPRASEDKFQSRLKLGVEGLVRIPGHVDHKEPHDRREDHRAKASPDNFTRARVAIDFGQHVPEDVGDWKEEVSGAEGQAEKNAGLARPNQVRAEQDRHETRHNKVVIAIVAGIRDEFVLAWVSGGGHLQARFLSVCGALVQDRRGLQIVNISRDVEQPVRKDSKMYQTLRPGQKRTKDLLNDQYPGSAVENPSYLTPNSDFVVPRFDANTLHASLHELPYPRGESDQPA